MTTPIYCERHPSTETALTCGRCEAPICPQCLVHTPGGIRCPDCANLRRPPMYELAARDILIALAVAAVLAVPLGFVGSILLPDRRGGFIIALLAGLGAGALIAESTSRLTGRKRGLAMQLIAVGGVVAAGILRIVFADIPLDAVLRDTAGLLLVAIAGVTAWSRLR